MAGQISANELGARIAVLENILRTFMKDVARERGTPIEDIAQLSDRIKRQYEEKDLPVELESLLTAAVDQFFGPLIADLRKSREVNE